ncbi:hypothetical protein ALQ01_103449 [Pseudomonas savastanoi pv. glycinea]|nr:hypothetical protein ALQ01_103449 [Pseudomonas savastanoi pv. glycinea]
MWLLASHIQVNACFAFIIEFARLLCLRISHQLRLACLVFIKRQAAPVKVFKRQLMAFFGAEGTLLDSMVGGAAGEQCNGECEDKRKGKYTVHLGPPGQASFSNDARLRPPPTQQKSSAVIVAIDYCEHPRSIPRATPEPQRKACDRPASSGRYGARYAVLPARCSKHPVPASARCTATAPR